MSNKIIKIFSLLLALVLCLSVIGCSTSDKKDKDKTSSTASKDDTAGKNDGIESEPSEETEPGDGEEDMPPDDSYEELEPPAEDDTEIQTMNIYNAKPFNKTFKGINAIYQLVDGMSDVAGRVYTEKEKQTVYNRFGNMGLNMIRSYYGSGLAWDASKQKFDFDNADIQVFYQNCKEMQKRGIEIGITPHWTFRGLIDSTIDNNTEAVNVDITNAYGIYVAGDPDKTFKNLGEFTRQSVLAFKANGVNNIKYLFCFTEINNTFFYMDGTKPEFADKGMTEKRQYDRLMPLYDKAVTEIHNSLKSSGLRSQYKIVGPCDNWNYDDELPDEEEYSRMVKYTLEKMYDKVDIIGTHRGYDKGKEFIEDNYKYIPEERMQGTSDTILSAGKEFWIDEYNVASELRSDLAGFRAEDVHPWKGTALGAMTSALMGLGSSNVFLWNIAEQQWPNNQTFGTEFDNGIQLGGFMPSIFESYTPYHSYYACSLLTKYIGRGKTFTCDEGWGVYTGFIEREEGNVTLIAVNYNYDDVNVEYNFEKSLGGKTLYRHLYNPATVKPESEAKILGIDAKATKVTNGFFDTLPAGAVAVYTTIKD